MCVIFMCTIRLPVGYFDSCQKHPRNLVEHVMKEGVIFRGDGIYIIKGAKNMENAKKFLDFCTGFDAQKTMNDSLNRRTVRKDLPASPILKPITEIKVITDDEKIAQEKKQEWISKFKEIFTSM